MSDTYTYRPRFGYDIRIKPPKEDVVQRTAAQTCAWAGCQQKGLYRAPKSRDGQSYQWMCLDHVRAFNKSWNYFAGMSDEEVRLFQEESLTGHRPTWGMAASEARRAGPRLRTPAGVHSFTWRSDQGFGRPGADPFHLFGDMAARDVAARPFSPLTRAQRQALETLDLAPGVTLQEIKGRYKELVKRYHPDANGGDTGAVERLRRVIKAYQVLKTGRFGSNGAK